MLISTALCSRTGLGVAARAAFIICKWFRTCIVQKPGARTPAQTPALSSLSPRPPAHRCRRIPLWPSVAPGKNGQETRRPPSPKPRLHRRYIDLKALLPVRPGAACSMDPLSPGAEKPISLTNPPRDLGTPLRYPILRRPCTCTAPRSPAFKRQIPEGCPAPSSW